MPQRSVVAAGASLLVASLALSACGTRGGDCGTETGGGSSENKVAKIGVIAKDHPVIAVLPPQAH